MCTSIYESPAGRPPTSLQSAQSEAERPKRAAPASEICGAESLAPCFHRRWAVGAGRHSDRRSVGDEMYGRGNLRDYTGWAPTTQSHSIPMESGACRGGPPSSALCAGSSHRADLERVPFRQRSPLVLPASGLQHLADS
jgi:hypothetical protein